MKKLTGLALLMVSLTLNAQPLLESISHGEVSVQHQDTHTRVEQLSPKAIVDWQHFNIAPNESVHFEQPHNGIMLNRINPTNGPSFVEGRLTATGALIMVNGAGVHFSKSAYVNVGSLIASSFGISPENFKAGRFIFTAPGFNRGAVTNSGTIRAADHGLVALIGPTIANHGMINVNFGTVALANAESKVTLDFAGNRLIHFTVDGADPKAFNLVNEGKVYAEGGQVLVPAAVAGKVLSKVINLDSFVHSAAASQNADGSVTFHATHAHALAHQNRARVEKFETYLDASVSSSSAQTPTTLSMVANHDPLFMNEAPRGMGMADNGGPIIHDELAEQEARAADDDVNYLPLAGLRLAQDLEMTEGDTGTLNETADDLNGQRFQPVMKNPSQKGPFVARIIQSSLSASNQRSIMPSKEEAETALITIIE